MHLPAGGGSSSRLVKLVSHCTVTIFFFKLIRILWRDALRLCKYLPLIVLSPTNLSAHSLMVFRLTKHYCGLCLMVRCGFKVAKESGWATHDS